MSLVIACRKVCHATRSEAAAAAVKLISSGADREPGNLLRPYYCEPCDAWHIGHESSRSIETS